MLLCFKYITAIFYRNLRLSGFKTLDKKTRTMAGF